MPEKSIQDQITISHPNITEDTSKNETIDKPVIYLFGWSGAEKEDILKYTEMYNTNGYTTVSYTAPWDYIFLNVEKIPGVAREVVEYTHLIEKTTAKRPKVFHVFSIDGCTVYQHFTQEILTNDAYQDFRDTFKGIIFDSCPGKRVAQTFINSIGFVLGGNVLRRKTVPFFYFVYFIGKSIFRGISGAEDPTFWWDYLKEEDTLLMPNLYIYSKGDVCVNPEHTKEMAALRREKGINVTEKVFEDSKHVSHFDKYPEEYQKACLDFLQSLIDT